MALACACGLAASAAHADDNPGYDRPGLGFTPVALSRGDVTIEQGLPTWTRDHLGAGQIQSQYTTDSLIRLGLGGPFEAQLGTSPFNAVQTTGAGDDSWAHGRGDTILGLKYAPCKAVAKFTWGLLGSVEFTDGDQAVRNEHRQYLLGADLNWQVTDNDGVGAYLEQTHSGHDGQSTLAVNESHVLSHVLVGYVELAQVHERGERSGTEAGTGVAWQLNRRVQIDGGVRARIAGHAQLWMASMGVSVFLGR
ncbi:transporter [Dyella telluris]|uniref:Transporter n=1 Tax=Dyella telluris TaxID=2763498 RepID=A0A7G8Q549_9GAMM|nr:transporter [Dyella telluris]